MGKKLDLTPEEMKIRRRAQVAASVLRIVEKDRDAWNKYCREWAQKKAKLNPRHRPTAEELEIKRTATRERKSAQHRIWAEENRKKLTEYTRRYERERRLRDPAFRLRKDLRARLRLVLIGKDISAGSAIRLLGCSIESARQHIEAQFRDGMNWNNWSRSGWHVDHILPLSFFDLSDPKQLQAACHFSNLQPLWAAENISKGGWADGRHRHRRDRSGDP